MKANSRMKGNGNGPGFAGFDRFAQRATEQVGRWWFFAVAALAVLAWLPTLVVWDTGPSDLLVDSITNPASLLLLILLQNSQNRESRAKDYRQDEIEHGLAAVLRHLAAGAADPRERERLEDRADRLVHNAEATSSLSTAGTEGSHERRGD